MKCSVCKCDLRAGKSWTAEENGKTYRYINMVCMNRTCPEYKKVVTTIKKEVNDVPV